MFARLIEPRGKACQRPTHMCVSAPQVSAKDREIAGLADKLEAALQAAADATTAASAAAAQGSIAGLKGAPSDAQVRQAIAQAQSQVCAEDHSLSLLLARVPSLAAVLSPLCISVMEGGRVVLTGLWQARCKPASQVSQLARGWRPSLIGRTCMTH